MQAIIHPFEAAGLGLAPFHFDGMSEKTYQACSGAPVQAGGSCDYCGTGIRYCCHIRSSDGKTFIVGTDCVLKLDREDNRLVSQVEREIAKREKEKRNAKKRAKWEAARLAREAELQAQRERNGGLTDLELATKQRQEQEALAAAQTAQQNAWLLDVLSRVPYHSDFVSSIMADLERKPINSFSPRCLDILADIYAKTVSGARKGSKVYNDAIAAFETHSAK